MSSSRVELLKVLGGRSLADSSKEILLATFSHKDVRTGSGIIAS